MDSDEADGYLRDYWRKEYDWIDISDVDAVYDEKTGEERVTMDGTARMQWKGDGGALGRHYEADGAVLGWKPNYHRDAGPGHDAPYASRYPYFAKMTETIVLPDGGKGFALEGDEVDRRIGAWEFKRTAGIKDGTFTVEAATRTIKPDFPAAEVKTVTADLRAMSDQTIYLRAPKTAGRDGNVDLAAAKTAANCQADLPPLQPVSDKLDTKPAAPGVKP